MFFLHSFSKYIDRTNKLIGNVICWLTLAMVCVQFLVVVLRYVFLTGSTSLQESIWYMHGVIFMVAAGATYLTDDHVRIDVFYREKSKRYRSWVNLLGNALLLLPICIATIWLSWGYVVNSWAILEGSIELSGLPIVFLYKTVIWVFALLLGAQSLSEIAKSILVISGNHEERQQ